MDLFTHMLIGYMLGWTACWTVTGYNEYLLLITVVMAMLPDFDVFLFLIPKSVRRKVRGVKHRGISHTIVFVAAASVIMALIFNQLVRTDLLEGILLAFIGGISHITVDGLTSFAFPYLAPFSWKERSADLDGAVTGYMVLFSLLSVIAMWSMRAYNVPFEYFIILVALVFTGIGIHYMLRLAVKLYTERILYKGQKVKVNPTPMLLKFYVMKPTQLKGVNMVEYIHTKLPVGREQTGRRYFEVDRLVPDGAGIKEPRDIYEAVVATSGAVASKGFENISNVAAAPVDSKEGEWKLFWFDWNDWNPVGRGTPGTLVTLRPGGELSVEGETRPIRW
jgi:membrane-bound metal-dependent hydrolase YbcI (DUF457 family)